MFSNGDTQDFEVAIVDLMKRNRDQAKEIRSLKIEQDSQAMMLCEITEQKKRAIEDKAIIEDDKRNLANRLEEKSIELARFSNMQLDTLSQMMNAHHELNVKDIEISTLKMQNEQLQNNLRREKEIAESFNKSSEAIKQFEQFLKSPRSNNDTSRLGFTSTKEGESSKSAEERSEKVRTLNPLVISMVERDTPLMYAGVRNLISRTNPRTRVTITNAISKDTKHKITGPKL